MEFLNQLINSPFGRVITSGAVVNFFIVILGTLIGLMLKKGISENMRKALMTAMAFCVLYIGVTGIFEDKANILIIIVCFALGSILGEAINLDKHITRLGEKIENKFSNNKNSKIADGFVTATLLFCVGAMTIVGSINSGIMGDNSTLYSKSVIDCVAAAALASSMGIGVIFSCFSILIIEGGLTLLAKFVAPLLTEYIIAQISVIGSLLIIALALNMLNITKIKVMNFTPAILLPLFLCLFR